MQVVFFHKKVIQLGGAEIALINQINAISDTDVNNDVILLTYFIVDELKEKINTRVKIIAPTINYFRFIFILNIITKLNVKSIICGSGYLDLFFLRIFVKFNYVLEDHQPIVLSESQSLISSIQLRKKIKLFIELNGAPDLFRFNLLIVAKYSILYYLLKKLYKNARAILVLSEFARQEKLALFGVESHISFCGVDLKSNFLKISQLKTPEKFIFSISRLHRNKNLDLLIAAYFESGLFEKSIYLIIAGDGPEMNRLKEIATDFNIQEYVVFTGLLSDDFKREYLSKCLFFFNPQFADYNITVNEAMCLGKLCVTSSITELNPAFKHFGNDIRFSRPDKDEFLSALFAAEVACSSNNSSNILFENNTDWLDRVYLSLGSLNL